MTSYGTLSIAGDQRTCSVICDYALAHCFDPSAGAQTFDSADADTLNEIVVTAEKRESTVQKTPFSITAILEPS